MHHEVQGLLAFSAGRKIALMPHADSRKESLEAEAEAEADKTLTKVKRIAA